MVLIAIFNPVRPTLLWTYDTKERKASHLCLLYTHPTANIKQKSGSVIKHGYWVYVYLPPQLSQHFQEASCRISGFSRTQTRPPWLFCALEAPLSVWDIIFCFRFELLHLALLRSSTPSISIWVSNFDW